MTSSSSLYGTVSTQSTNSGNSTSLYGEAGTPIPDTAGNLVVRGDLVVLSGNILTTATTGNIFPANATTVNLALAATAVNIGASTGTTNINNNLTVDGTDITIAQGTSFLYSEANNRLNRPNFQSTTGNSSGVRAIGPNTTASSVATISAFSSSDLNNGSFINIQARNGVVTNPLRIQTGLYTGGTIGASGTSLAFIDNATTYATVNPSGPAIGTDLTTKTYVDTQISTSTVTSITGTANQVIVSSPTGAITLSLPQSIATTSNVTFADITATDDLTVQGNNVNLAQATIIGYSENNDRLNRPDVRSTTGNSSGFRVSAPNATTSASAVVSTFNTNDPDNGKFININARGNVTTPLRIQTGEYVAGTLGASGDSIVFVDGSSAAHATINPAGPTVGTDLTTKTYVDSLPAGGVTSITGTANQVIASSSTGAITLSLPQSIATTSNVTFADVIVGDDLTVQGNNVNLAQATIIGYSENNDRLNRPDVRSTTGNASGFRVSAPNATTSASAVLSTFNTNDPDNGKFININARGNVTTPLRIQTGQYTGGTLGASGDSIVFVDGSSAAHATINPAGPTNPTDLTTKAYVDALPAGGVTSITGTADQVIASSSTGAITLSLPQSIATTSSPTFAGATLGNITVGVATDQTIATTSGDLILDSASGTLQLADAALSSTVAQTWTVIDNTASALSIGASGKADILKIVSTNAAEGVTMSGTLGVTGIATIGDDSRVLGQMYATRSTTWTAPPTTQTTLAGQNGFYAASSANGAGFAPVIQAIYYSGDTTAGTNSAAAFTGRGAGGTNSAPSACATNQVLGTINFDGYGTTNFANSVATANAGAGTAALNPLQVQGYARQAFADSAAVSTTVTGASGTGSVATLTFTTQNTAPYAVGQTVTIAGMTPSGYNGTVVITVATTSSISYANATTGFTSGGTITAARTVTQAGMGFRVRGYASSTNMTTANRFNFIDLTATTASFKSAAYTFANDVITGSTLTATNYMTLGSTAHTIGNIDGPTNIVRAGTSAGQRPVQTVRYTQTATTAPATGDGPTYRLTTAGTNGTVYNLAEIGSAYDSGGNTNFSFGLANGDQNTGTMTVVFPLTSSLGSTVIRATASPTATPGGNTLTAVATFETTKITAAAPIAYPSYTTAQRNALTPAAGWVLFNSTTVKLQCYDGTNWQDLF